MEEELFKEKEEKLRIKIESDRKQAIINDIATVGAFTMGGLTFTGGMALGTVALGGVG